MSVVDRLRSKAGQLPAQGDPVVVTARRRALAAVDVVAQALAVAYAKVIVRGGAVTDPEMAGGAFYCPSLVEVERLDAALAQHEVFGPVQTFEDHRR